MEGNASEVSGITSGLRLRGRASGAWVQMDAVENCDIASRAGFDFVIIDMEHGIFGLQTCVNMIRAVEAGGAEAIVRVSSDSVVEIRKVFESGAQGVVIHAIKTAEQAQRIINATRFEPDGNRGACPYIRATGHGLEPWSSYLERSPRQSRVWFMIETREAVDNIEAILATGPDGVVFGPFDLSMAYGERGNTSHPVVLDALFQVQDAANVTGIATVVTIMSREADAVAKEVQQWEERGARIFLTATDRGLLTAGYAGLGV